MAARRYTIRLYRGIKREAQEDLNLDPADNKMLRKTLETMVKKVHGTLECDLSEWRIVVHNLGGGMVRARCRVSSSGETKVTR
jgi:hypothetical protein